MISLLLSFTTVLDEFGVSQGRAKRAALCAVEGLLMVRPAPFYMTVYHLTHTSLGRSSIEATLGGERVRHHQCCSDIRRYYDILQVACSTYRKVPCVD